MNLLFLETFADVFLFLNYLHQFYQNILSTNLIINVMMEMFLNLNQSLTKRLPDCQTD